MACIHLIVSSCIYMGFPCGSAGKESACNAGDLGSIPGLGKSPGVGEGNGTQLQCFCLRMASAPIPTLFLSLLFLYSSVALLPQIGSLLGWS